MSVLQIKNGLRLVDIFCMFVVFICALWSIFAFITLGSVINYRVKPVTAQRNGLAKTVYLIAMPHINSDGKDGFLIYETTEPGNWYARDNRPLIDSILFKTAEEAFEAAEKILKTGITY